MIDDEDPAGGMRGGHLVVAVLLELAREEVHDLEPCVGVLGVRAGRHPEHLAQQGCDGVWEPLAGHVRIVSERVLGGDGLEDLGERGADERVVLDEQRLVVVLIVVGDLREDVLDPVDARDLEQGVCRWCRGLSAGGSLRQSGEKRMSQFIQDQVARDRVASTGFVALCSTRP